jgi:DNA-binding CsgD family transcriptional regulator
MGIRDFTRARDRLLALNTEQAGAAGTLEEILAALHGVARFSWCTLMTVDPQTLLPTGGVVEGFPTEACAPFWDTELLLPGFNKFTELARSTEPVATLADATDGDLRRAPIYTNVYAPLDAADELRAAFVLGSTCWGIAALVRATGDGPFPDHEIAHIRALAPLVARILKASMCKLDAGAAGSAAMLVVDEHGGIQALTVEASQLLEDLRTGGVDEPGLPTIIGAVATRARASRAATHLATRVRGSSGRWLRATAIPMQGDDGSVAVMIEPARPGDITHILLESYGLTEREAEIVMLIARGLATKDIAAELSLSAHTIRDHIKAIFGKAGVSTRGELVARLFAEHFQDGFHAATHRVA